MKTNGCSFIGRDGRAMMLEICSRKECCIDKGGIVAIVEYVLVLWDSNNVGLRMDSPKIVVLT